jgi:hypothetical protein
MRRFAVLGVTALLTAVSIFLPPAASAGKTTIRPVQTCAELVRTYALPDAVTHVTAATVVPATATESETCDVRGYVEPAVQFQLKLPTTTYSGRYLQYGCGGFCGYIAIPAFAGCDLPHGGDVAVAATDGGHVGTTPFAFDDGKWAANSQAARDDFAFRGAHVVSRASKHLITTFYGAPPSKSYFSGCGREALLLAQRYPHDFNGIVTGAQAGYWGPLFGVYQTWLARANTGADGQPILTREKLPALHNAALSSCDGADGLLDGAIDDPRICTFDPATLTCPPGTDNAGCLTAAQVVATKKLYAPPTDENGRKLYPGGQTVGSELAWAWGDWILPSPETGGVAFARLLADSYLKYMAYPLGTPHSSVDQFSFTAAEFNRLTAEGVRSNAMSTDLGEFRRAGGKLILWHGWADQAIPATGTLDYYQRITRASGGLAATQSWARLFVVPGLYHCGNNGNKLTEYNPLPGLFGWVERGAAPDRTIAVGRDAAGNVARTRPVFPYPVVAKYDGSGSIDDAANFVAAPPARPVDDIVNWAGNDLYGRPGPVAP